MAKKLGKFLSFVAVATAATVGGLALYKKYKDAQEENMDYDEDFDLEEDFDEDFSDITSDSGREYVTLNLDNASGQTSTTDSTDSNAMDDMDDMAAHEEDDELNEDAVDEIIDEIMVDSAEEDI